MSSPECRSHSQSAGAAQLSVLLRSRTTMFVPDHELVNNNNFYSRVRFAQVLMAATVDSPASVAMTKLDPKSGLLDCSLTKSLALLLIDCFDYDIPSPGSK